MTRSEEKPREEGIKAACGLVLDDNKPLGSCFRIAERYALTCAHVPRDKQRVYVRFGAGPSAGTIVSIDENSDAALIELVTAGPFCMMVVSNPEHGDAWRTFGYPAIAKANDGGIVGHWFHGTVNDVAGLDTKRQPALVLESPMVKDERVHGLSGSPVLVDGNAIGMLKRILPRTQTEPTAAFGFLYASTTEMVRSLLIRASIAFVELPRWSCTDDPRPARFVRTVTLRQARGELRSEPQRFSLRTIRVGRGRDNDLEISHMKISEHHGLFFFRGEALYYQDTSRGGSALVSGGRTQQIAFEETVEVPLLSAVELGESGVRIEVTSIGKGLRDES